eukprot:7387494-Alexandrium_andersonii.AAC.1
MCIRDSHCHAVGVAVFVEWPRHCACWHEPRIRGFLEEWGFEYADFDGCVYGLRPVDPSLRWARIRKPWRIACLSSSFPSRLNKTCAGLHPRLPREGRGALHTHGYA